MKDVLMREGQKLKKSKTIRKTRKQPIKAQPNTAQPNPKGKDTVPNEPARATML